MKFKLLSAFMVFLLLTSCSQNGSTPTDEDSVKFRQINTQIVEDMKLSHEGVPHGIPDGYSWKYKPALGAGNTMPAEWQAFIAWGQLFGRNASRNRRPST